MINSSDFGKAIREARTSQNMTQLQLAAISGVGVRFIIDLEKGKPTCALDKSLTVAKMLGLNLTINKR